MRVWITKDADDGTYNFWKRPPITNEEGFQYISQSHICELSVKDFKELFPEIKMNDREILEIESIRLEVKK
jgi:hypothetical protein